MRAQLLTSQRPPDLLTAVRRLTMLQLDPVSAVAPSADLVAWSRLGAAYHPDDLKAAIGSRTVIELRAFLRPAEDFALYRAEMAAWPGAGELRDWQVFNRDWVAANDLCRREILVRLAADGPLQSRELPDTCEKPWQSTGWTNNKNITRLLGFMVSRGEVAVAGRKGRERLWDLAERVYPDHPVLPVTEAERERRRRRLAALGIARHAGPRSAWSPPSSGRPGEPAEVEGVKGRWRVDPAYLDGTPGAWPSRAAPPCFPRSTGWCTTASARLSSSTSSTSWKCTSRRATRRWGYYALPILYGDRLVGKLDAAADRKAGVLMVNAVHQDVPFTRETSAAIDAEIAAWPPGSTSS